MSRRRNDDWDDGRTVADMSDVPHGMLSGVWLPGGGAQPGGSDAVQPGAGSPPGGFGARRRRRELMADEHEPQPRPWEEAPLSRRERRMYVLGALKASLLIGGAYLLALGLLIAVMVRFWS